MEKEVKLLMETTTKTDELLRSMVQTTGNLVSRGCSVLHIVILDPNELAYDPVVNYETYGFEGERDE